MASVVGWWQGGGAGGGVDAEDEAVALWRRARSSQVKAPGASRSPEPSKAACAAVCSRTRLKKRLKTSRFASADDRAFWSE